MYGIIKALEESIPGFGLYDVNTKPFRVVKEAIQYLMRLLFIIDRHKYKDINLTITKDTSDSLYAVYVATVILDENTRFGYQIRLMPAAVITLASIKIGNHLDTADEYIDDSVDVLEFINIQCRALQNIINDGGLL